MNFTVIAGSFNDAGGKHSGWADKFCAALTEQAGPGCIRFFHNGGTWDDLVHNLESLPDTGIVLWLADVPNDKPKIVNQIKEKHPKVFLVTSKRNLEGTYSVQDLVSRALAVKANLLLEITGDRTQLQTTILDPLGNVFLVKEANLNRVVQVLVSRLNTLTNVKRISSRQIGEAKNFPNDPQALEFLEIVKAQAETSFMGLIPPECLEMPLSVVSEAFLPGKTQIISMSLKGMLISDSLDQKLLWLSNRG